METSRHPLWLVGFRPFFILAMLSGIILPPLWALIFNSILNTPNESFSPIPWHAHEMFFGFGLAVLGGFLLTASKNWVKIRGYHGPALMLLTGAWIFERLGMFVGGSWPSALFLISNHLFLGMLVAMLLWTLIRHRQTDSYKDNIFFILILPLFWASKYFILTPEYFRLGVSMINGLFRMAFLLMLERTLTQFMKSIYQVELLRNFALDTAIKTLGLLLIFENLLPLGASDILSLGLALLLLVRFVFWKPQFAFRRIDIAVMYLGYLAIALQLLVEVSVRNFNTALIGSVATHIFTFGTMGLIIPAMMVRISNGHTGRKVSFGAKDKAVLWIMILAFGFRILAPQVFPARYALFIFAAAACWSIGFLILAWSYIPYLLQPRIDGKDH